MNQAPVVPPKQLRSSDLIAPESSFRVRAGPGAGKTYWLVEHIKNVLQRGKRVGPASLVGCISYTEVAAAEILKRLGDAADRVDVSTIHSFLYRVVVRPYLHMLKAGNGQPLVNMAYLDGHDKHYPSIGRFRGHAKSRKSQIFLNASHGDDRVMRCLNKLAWRIVDSGWELSARTEKPPMNLPVEDLLAYKQSFWAQGTIHHDDVLYFAHRLLSEHPTLREFLSSRYPYLFVDEFQDTTPAQTQIIEWLAAQGTIVGVIGDPEQSIYEFTGAKPQDFDELKIDNCADYEIRGNRRSSQPIVDVLNLVRRDGLQQESLVSTTPPVVTLYAGFQKEVLVAIDKMRTADWSHAVLFRANHAVRMARLGTSMDGAGDLWERLSSEESDLVRQRFIRSFAEAHAYAQFRKIGDAIGTLSKGLRRLVQKGSPPLIEPYARHLALTLIEHLLRNYSAASEESLLKVYSGILETLASTVPRVTLSKYGKGKAREFAESVRYADLVATAEVADVCHEARTIHSAKGAEFDSVVVWLEPENLKRLLHKASATKGNCSGNEDEERRILYVAMSRARRRLILGAEGPLSKADLAVAKALKIDVIEIVSG